MYKIITSQIKICKKYNIKNDNDSRTVVEVFLLKIKIILYKMKLVIISFYNQFISPK